MLVRIVSGGQSGVDRAALDAALRHGVPYGGWCPAGGLAEDRSRPPGVLADYPLLRATPSTDPAQRTAWNVRDSDAVLVVRSPDALSPGTAATIETARSTGRPLLVTTGDDPDAVLAWLADLGAVVLDVAGPRASQWPAAYDVTSRLLDDVLPRLG